MNTQTLDVIGLKCPLPILRAKKALAQHRQLQSEKRLYFMGLQGGVQVSAV